MLQYIAELWLLFQSSTTNSNNINEQIVSTTVISSHTRLEHTVKESEPGSQFAVEQNVYFININFSLKCDDLKTRS